MYKYKWNEIEKIENPEKTLTVFTRNTSLSLSRLKHETTVVELKSTELSE
jgi:hypothetical protein